MCCWARGRCGFRSLLVALILTTGLEASAGTIDHSRYMFVDEIRPGMKGYGKTVLSGTEIQIFEVEIISIMRNAWNARQDVILVRCSGLNLEHSGIIGGMSGSPCYIEDEQGRARMIGAVAFGWMFNKDPICGVQPIEQMLDVLKVRDPAVDGPASSPTKGADGSNATPPADGRFGGKVSLSEIAGRSMRELLPEDSRFAIFNESIRKGMARRAATDPADRLGPLMTPVMMSGVRPETISRLREPFASRGLTPVTSGAAGAIPGLVDDAGAVKLEPGSAICVPLLTGDLQIEALGTCTEVVDDRVLGFGHAFFGEGSVKLPMATGMVHTVIPSVMRSNKVGASLQTVGTLWGDESTAISGSVGSRVDMIPMEVEVIDVRGERTYRYNLVQEWFFTPMLLSVAAQESMFSHNAPPRFHTVRYTVETEYKGLGSFLTENISSQDQGFSAVVDAMLPVRMMLNSPFGEAELERARLKIRIEEGASTGTLVDMLIPKTKYKPGETIVFKTRWHHERQKPVFSDAQYTFTLPEDLPDGTYGIIVGPAATRVRALQAEKPHLFDTRSLEEILEGLNMIGSFRQDRLYISMAKPGEGVAYRKLEMPDLPSHRRKILLQNKPSDMHVFTEAHVEEHPLDFVPRGQRTFMIEVQRREAS